MTTYTPKKLRAGSYQLGNLIISKQEPTTRGGTTTWRSQRGKLIGYSLGDVNVGWQANLLWCGVCGHVVCRCCWHL